MKWLKISETTWCVIQVPTAHSKMFLIGQQFSLWKLWSSGLNKTSINCFRCLCHHRKELVPYCICTCDRISIFIFGLFKINKVNDRHNTFKSTLFVIKSLSSKTENKKRWFTRQIWSTEAFLWLFVDLAIWVEGNQGIFPWKDSVVLYRMVAWPISLIDIAELTSANAFHLIVCSNEIDKKLLDNRKERNRTTKFSNNRAIAIPLLNCWYCSIKRHVIYQWVHRYK